MNDAVRPAPSPGPITARVAAGKTRFSKPAPWLLLLAGLLSQGCSSPPPSAHQEGADGAPLATAVPEGWPCDHRALDSRHCRLQAAEGFQRHADPDAMRFEHTELDASLSARIIRGPSGAGADGAAREIIEAWQARLSPAASWDQDPQGPVGFEVRGISGSAVTRLSADPEHRPQQFHVVSYRNPRTGSILLLEAQAAPSDWKQAWQLLAPVFAEVRLTAAF